MKSFILRIAKTTQTSTRNIIFTLMKPAQPIVFNCSQNIKTNGFRKKTLTSAISHPTKKKISEFVDYHLIPHVRTLPSYIQDTTDYLKKRDTLYTLLNNTILVSMDVCSLYTYILNNEGVVVCEKV